MAHKCSTIKLCLTKPAARYNKWLMKSLTMHLGLLQLPEIARRVCNLALGSYRLFGIYMLYNCAHSENASASTCSAQSVIHACMHALHAK